MTDDNEPTRPIELSRRDARTLYRALKAHRGKLERAAAKSTFVPEPGKGDATLSALARARDVEARLRDFLGEF